MSGTVTMRGISRNFGSLVALDAVDFTAEKGEIHALVGENGAGKTTLMRVLYGVVQPDRGEYQVDGQTRHFANADQAIAAGVGMVSQHYSIIPELTALQNLMLGAEPGFVIPYAAARERAQSLAAQMGFSFQWDEEAGTLSPAQAQKLEILKLLWRNTRVLILDEPTAMLAPEDADLLYAKLKKLAADGATVIVVTHRLPEVMAYADQVTVLRGGKLIKTGAVRETTASEIAEQMVGHAVPEYQREPNQPGQTMLETRSLGVRSSDGRVLVADVDLNIRAGELVGIAGVDGNGQRELFQALLGVIPSTGAISVAGKSLENQSPSKRISAGLRLIAEDRHREAVIEKWSIADNAILGLQRTPDLARRGTIDPAERARMAEACVSAFPTKYNRVSQPLHDLSGGNQQKVVVSRAFLQEPKVILAFQPTRGIDLYVATLVYLKMIEFVRAGGAGLVVSFDLDELMAFCDRLLVMREGRIEEVSMELRDDRQAVGRMMVGAP